MTAGCLTIRHRCAASAGRRSTTSVQMVKAWRHVVAGWMTAPGWNAVRVARLRTADAKEGTNEAAPVISRGGFFCLGSLITVSDTLCGV